MLIPESSDIYSYTSKVTTATGPRAPGSVVLDKPSDNPKDYELSVVYRYYERKEKVTGKPVINMAFQQGNGMTKGFWHYQIDQLYQLYPNLNVVVIPDFVCNAESAVLNKDKLGHNVDWTDLTKDLIKVVKEDEKEHFLKPESLNILVGLSSGGLLVLEAVALEPSLFDCVVSVNPASYIDQTRINIITRATRSWDRRNLLRSEYPVREGETYRDAVYRGYRLNSFFKDHTRVVLHNMLEDEMPKEEEKIKDGVVYTNTTGQQEYFTYFTSIPAVYKSQSYFPIINTPVYHITGTNDSMSLEGIRKTREALKHVIHPIDVEGAGHVFNGDWPDLFIDLMKDIVDKRIEIYNNKGDSRYQDKEHLKKYGKSYRSELKKIAYKEGLTYNIPYEEGKIPKIPHAKL